MCIVDLAFIHACLSGNPCQHNGLTCTQRSMDTKLDEQASLSYRQCVDCLFVVVPVTMLVGQHDVLSCLDYGEIGRNCQ